MYEEDSVTSGLPVLSGAIELPEGWLFSEVFDLEVELRPPDGSPCRSLDKQSMSLQVKVHPVCDIPRGAMRAARQASMRASEEQAEMDAVKAMALTGDLAKSPVRTGSIGRSLSRYRNLLSANSNLVPRPLLYVRSAHHGTKHPCMLWCSRLRVYVKTFTCTYNGTA